MATGRTTNNYTEVFSDVSNGNDGIGVEIIRDGKCKVIIFRDDTKKTRVIQTFGEEISLELMEEAIAIFKKEIPWEFIEYGNE